MNHVIYIKYLFESVPDFRKIELLIFLIQNDDDLLKEKGLLKSDINRLNLEFKHTLMEQNEEYLSHINNEEESVIERILNKKMETYFSILLEDIRYKRTLCLLLSITDPDTLKQSKFVV